MNKIPDIKFFQKRVANGAISSSTLRNQGKSGCVKEARKYLMNPDRFNLKEFSNVKEEKFGNLLNKHTEKLRKKLPNNKWGTARKAINVFLLRVSLDYFLSKKYKLRKIIPYLEIPLDSYAYKGLKEDVRKLKKDGELKVAISREKFPKWPGIINLRSETSEIFQEFASEVAKREYKYHRVFLDLEYWRKDKIKQRKSKQNLGDKNAW